MKIGRNEPCPCGSGKKYKKCCLNKFGKETSPRIVTTNFNIDMDSFPPRVDGLEDMPDLKWWIERALRDSFIHDRKTNPRKAVDGAMQSYNERMVEVNAKLSSGYGELLIKMKAALAARKYTKALRLADSVLGVFPESAEAKIVKDKALLGKGEHPLELISARIAMADAKQKQKLFEKFFNLWVDSSAYAKEVLFYEMEQNYNGGADWKERYAALDIIKHMLFFNFEDFAEDFIERLYQLLVKALRDDDGRVRNNAVYCVSHQRGFVVPIGLFFMICDAAEQETDDGKKRALCRALLELVFPVMDDAMRAEGLRKEYRRAIDYALKITGYDKTYYKAEPLKKMLINWRDPKRKMRKYGNK